MSPQFAPRRIDLQGLNVEPCNKRTIDHEDAAWLTTHVQGRAFRSLEAGRWAALFSILALTVLLCRSLYEAPVAFQNSMTRSNRSNSTPRGSLAGSRTEHKARPIILLLGTTNPRTTPLLFIPRRGREGRRETSFNYVQQAHIVHLFGVTKQSQAQNAH